MFRSLLLLSALLLSTSTIDLCEIVNKDYCFYFGESSCYLKICECEQEKCTEGPCTYSYWCDTHGDYVINDTDIEIIDTSCDSLRLNCLEKKSFNGYCHLYKEKCPLNQEVENKTQTRSLEETCKKWGQTCARKWSRHFSCRQFKKFCHAFSLPPRVGNITDELDDIRVYHHPEEHGEHWERNMISRCRRWQSHCFKHNDTRACRKVDRRCGDFLSNLTIPYKKEDSSSEEENDESVRILLANTNKTETTTLSGVETATGPNYKKNMKARCRSWWLHCKKHRNSGQCETYSRRCADFSENYKQNVATLLGNSTIV